jgi:hypothetical protein
MGMKMDTQPPNPDKQIEHIRALFEEINKTHKFERKGIGKFLHNLAERMSQPQKKVIMKRVLEAEPRKNNIIQQE